MNILLGFIVACCLVVSNAYNYDNAYIKCPANCPNTEEVVWALDGLCSVYRNKCHFEKANCQRKPPMTIVSKEECQKRCPEVCILIFQPVTGTTYKGEVKTFSNSCLKNVHSCTTGETFVD